MIRRRSNSPQVKLSLSEAARYVGVHPLQFMTLVSQGQMPKPIRNTGRRLWQLTSVDRAYRRRLDIEAPRS